VCTYVCTLLCHFKQLPFVFVMIVAIAVMVINVCTCQICGVSILRAGETMEPALCDICKDVSLGKILIQTNLDTGEPEASRALYTFVIIVLHCLNVLKPWFGL